MQNNNLIYKIVSSLDQAFAFFNKNGDLEYYNESFLKLWNLEKKEVDETKPSIVDFFSIIIENNTLIITESLSQFIESLKRTLAQSELNISKTILCNPNKVINETVTKLEEGILFVWKDNTDINNLYKQASIVNSNISQIVKNIPLPMLFIESTGKIIEQSNHFNQSLGIVCKEGMHIRELLTKLSNFITSDLEFTKIVDSTLNQQEYSNMFTKSDNSLYIKVIPMLASKSMFIASLEQNEIDVMQNLEALKQSLQESYNNIYLKLDSYLNNHISNSKNYIELVASNYAGEINKKQAVFLQKAQENIKEMSDYISYHADGINIEDQKEDMVQVNIEDIITNNVIGLKNEIEHKKINLTLDLTNSMFLRSHPKQLNRLLKVIFIEILDKLPYKGILNIYSNKHSLEIKHNCRDLVFSKQHQTQDIKSLFMFSLLKALSLNITQEDIEGLKVITFKSIK